MKHKKWTFEEVLKVAKSYNRRIDFRKNNSSAYQWACRNKHLDIICSHMMNYKDSYSNSATIWNYNSCKKEILKYKTLQDFYTNSGSCYSKCKKNKWHQDLISKLEVKGNRHNRFIYIYEFKDKTFYVGLTYNYKIRHTKHLSSGIVSKKIKNGLLKNYIKEGVLYKATKAELRESEIRDWYINKGWTPLAKAGGLGCTYGKWTKEKCRELALKYKYLKDFRTKEKAAYNAADRHGWLDYVNQGLIYKCKPKGYWNKERCIIETKKYNSIKELRANNESVYNKILQKKWAKEILEHFYKRAK